MPEVFDGIYTSSNRERDIDFQNQEPIQLLVRLSKKTPVSALHWIGSGFTTRLEVRTRPDGPILSVEELQDFHLLEWPELETDVLYLTLRPEHSGFIRVRELRILGKDR